ncbi:MAG: ATP-binding cassette domain-containing protein, partial [Alphaproteobacteria bacterium]|nr:ATP-binding cassette domain-containing protein [Alphaproteobacteria bacterium]
MNFSLKEKTFNILIGENGSGKTTLVKCIRQIINYEGDIEFF